MLCSLQSNGTASVQPHLGCPLGADALGGSGALERTRGGGEVDTRVPLRPETPLTIGERHTLEGQVDGAVAFRPQAIIASTIHRHISLPLVKQLYPPTRTADGWQRLGLLRDHELGRNDDLGGLEYHHEDYRTLRRNE